MKNRFDTIVEGVIFYVGLIALGVIWIAITTNLHAV